MPVEMAYTLGNKCAKNLCKRIVLLQLIIENVVTFFGTLQFSPDNGNSWNLVRQFFQVWEVIENNIGHGQSFKMIVWSWYFLTVYTSY